MPETLSPEDSKDLLGLCRAGKLYDIEKWIAGGKSIRTSPQIKKPPLQVAMDLGFHSLVELLIRNEDRVEVKNRALGDLSHSLIVQARDAFKHVQVSDSSILWTREQCIDIRVSKDSLDRAYRIMAGLITAMEERGFTVAVEKRRQEKQEEQTVVKIYGQVIRFGLTEKVDRVEIAAPAKGGLLERVLTYGGKPVTLEPSGRLSIEVWTEWGYNVRNWRDGKTQRLEDQLSRVVAGFMRLALADRAEQRRRAAEERERQRIAEERINLEKSIKAEQSRVNALRNATARWLRADQVRSFVSAARDAAVQNGQIVAPGSPFGDWIIWAEQQADRLDPLKESPASIIDRKTEPAPSYAGYYGYGYQKPDPPFRFPKPIWRMT